MAADRSIPIPRETLRLLLILLAIIGLVAVLFAVVQFIQSTQAMNAAQEAVMRLQPSVDAATTESANNSASMMMPLMMQKRDAEIAQTRSLFIGGAGLVAVGIGWLGMDLLRRKWD